MTKKFETPKDNSTIRLEMVYDDINYFYVLTPRAKKNKFDNTTWKCTMYTTQNHQDIFHLFSKTFERPELDKLLLSPFLKNVTCK